MKVKSVLLFPLHIFLWFCSAIFRILVHFHAALLTSILEQDCVQSAMSAILVRGMNDFLIQPDLNDKIQIMVDTMAKNQEEAAHKAGQEFPKLVGNFFHGMMNAKKQQQQQQQHSSAGTTSNNNHHSKKSHVDTVRVATEKQMDESSSSSSSTFMLASSSSSSSSETTSVSEEDELSTDTKPQRPNPSIPKEVTQRHPCGDNKEVPKSAERPTNKKSHLQPQQHRPFPFFGGGWQQQQQNKHTSTTAASSSAAATNCRSPQASRTAFFRRSISSSLPRTPTTATASHRPHSKVGDKRQQSHHKQ